MKHQKLKDFDTIVPLIQSHEITYESNTWHEGRYSAGCFYISEYEHFPSALLN